ncbi:MAG: hypothetical protein RIQ60_2027 [Pseudomonadota bacterium]|jgi:hypothetical protein
MSVLCAGPAQPHVGWVAIDELAHLLVHYFDAELLSPQPLAAGGLQRLLRRGRPAWQPLTGAGGDVLFVVARGPDDLQMLHAVPQLRRRYGRVVAWITDTYHHAGYHGVTDQCDAISVTAAEDIDFPRQRFGCQVHHVLQGIDALAWAPRRESARDVELIGFGRTPPSYHAALVDRFHRADSGALYLHSPLGHLAGPAVQAERAMLFKLLYRTQVALAFHLYVEPQHNRPRSMMVTSRWLESLVAGCIVAGKRPVSAMADAMLSWPGATIELDDNPRQACDQLAELFQRRDELAGQRRANIRHTLLEHDWRLRIRQLCLAFGLPEPTALAADLQAVQDLAGQFA